MSQQMKQKGTIIMSGMQTSGILHLGNYIGAIKNWEDMASGLQQEDVCFFMLADLHSLTTQKDPIKLRQNRIDCLIFYIACGLLNFHHNANIYFQSDIAEIPYLCWMLSNVTKIGELFRMTQFKDKKSTSGENDTNSGLLFYPVLMAADILILNPDFVPVGDDQKQHLELARNIAESFNREYGETFNIPKEKILPQGKRIMSLRYPEKKMSKSSSSESEVIYLTDSNDDIYKKIKSATTDSLKGIYFDKENRAGVSNLLEIFSCLADRSIIELSDYYRSKDTKSFKDDLSDAIIHKISPIREEILRLYSSLDFVLKIAENGKNSVSQIAQENITNIKTKVGL